MHEYKARSCGEWAAVVQMSNPQFASMWENQQDDEEKHCVGVFGPKEA